MSKSKNIHPVFSKNHTFLEGGFRLPLKGAAKNQN